MHVSLEMNKSICTSWYMYRTVVYWLTFFHMKTHAHSVRWEVRLIKSNDTVYCIQRGQYDITLFWFELIRRRSTWDLFIIYVCAYFIYKECLPWPKCCFTQFDCVICLFFVCLLKYKEILAFTNSGLVLLKDHDY